MGSPPNLDCAMEEERELLHDRLQGWWGHLREVVARWNQKGGQGHCGRPWILHYHWGVHPVIKFGGRGTYGSGGLESECLRQAEVLSRWKSCNLGHVEVSILEFQLEIIRELSWLKRHLKFWNVIYFEMAYLCWVKHTFGSYRVYFWEAEVHFFFRWILSIYWVLFSFSGDVTFSFLH